MLYDPVVIKDGDRYRLWYRTNFEAPPYYTGYAEGPDGIRWKKPSLRLITYGGSTSNNLLWPVEGGDGHVLSIFKDGNPNTPDTERYKAIAISNSKKGMVSLVSPDGIHWTNLRPEPIIVGPEDDPHFDSHNIAFWDAAHGYYVAYLRGWQRQKIRDIRRTTSPDFRHWSTPEYIDMGDAPSEHLYKNAATPYYRRPDIYLMFPKRFLPERKSDPTHESGLSDIVFMYSRDGIHWDRRFMEAFIRPGRDPNNWHHRAIEVGQGLVPTGEGEMSLYMVANYYTPFVHIRRMVLREDGFVSVHAHYTGGEFVTKPLTFEGRELVMNYATSVAGGIRVEVQDATGRAIPGFALQDAPEIYGDELERVVAWRTRSDVSGLSGQPIRLRFVMKDSDLYSIRFRP
ncbi:MAG: hypothetical protein HY709_03320 [Candidatus Latescibacteria bacterium]|nr:hypothetical protein [Candidatus Latescibacterota bacterium]